MLHVGGLFAADRLSRDNDDEMPGLYLLRRIDISVGMPDQPFRPVALYRAAEFFAGCEPDAVDILLFGIGLHQRLAAQIGQDIDCERRHDRALALLICF